MRIHRDPLYPPQKMHLCDEKNLSTESFVLFFNCSSCLHKQSTDINLQTKSFPVYCFIKFHLKSGNEQGRKLLTSLSVRPPVHQQRSLCEAQMLLICALTTLHWNQENYCDKLSLCEKGFCLFYGIANTSNAQPEHMILFL